jgi:hypothetical protein
MYEPNDVEQSLVCNIEARDESLEIMPPERGDRMLMPAPMFWPLQRSVRTVPLHQARPTLHMLIQRRLRANEERWLNGRDGGSHQKMLCASVLQRDDADTHTFSDLSAK